MSSCKNCIPNTEYCPNFICHRCAEPYKKIQRIPDEFLKMKSRTKTDIPNEPNKDEQTNDEEPFSQFSQEDSQWTQNNLPPRQRTPIRINNPSNDTLFDEPNINDTIVDSDEDIGDDDDT